MYALKALGEYVWGQASEEQSGQLVDSVEKLTELKTDDVEGEWLLVREAEEEGQAMDEATSEVEETGENHGSALQTRVMCCFAVCLSAASCCDVDF